MADREVQGLLIQIEATTAQLRRELAAADQAVARATAEIDRELSKVDSAFDRTGEGAQRAGRLMKGAFATLAGAGLVGGIIKQVDAIGQMNDRLTEATDSSLEYDLVQARLLETAKQTYRPLQEAQELYIRTADSMRGLGYDTQQTLDITDSFSYLLVTNAANADKAQSALDAYSKTLVTGKVGIDEWRSILNAMPTVVQAVADATGKSADEVKRLGIEGKLSLEDLNQGFLRTVAANQAATARMRASVTDALVNINTALGVYLGRVEDGTGTVGGLADVMNLVAENMGVVASVMAGAGVAALTLYSAKAAVAIKTALADRAARIAQAEAVLQSAIADQRKAQTATLLAAREAAAARGTAVQTQMSIQLAQARQREAAATATVTAAQAGLKASSAGLLAVLGGPMGLALTAGLVAASFLAMRDGAQEASGGLSELESRSKAVRASIRNLLPEDMKSMSFDALQGALVDLQGQLAAAEEERGRLQKGMDEGKIQSATWLDSANEKVEALQGAISQLETQMKRPEFSSDDAGSKYLQNLERQAALAGKVTEVEKLRANIQAGFIKLSEDDEKAAYARAAAIDKTNAATKSLTKSTRDQIKAIDAAIDQALPERKRLADLVEGVGHLRKAHGLGKLSAADMEQGIRNLNEAYAAVSLQKQTEQEQKLAAERRKGAEAYRQAMEVILESRQKAINADIEGVGLGDNEREQMDRLNAVRERYAQERRNLELQQEDASRRLSATAYEQRLADLERFQARELEMEIAGAEAKLAAQADWSNGARRAFQNLQAEANDFASATDKALTGSFTSAKDAFADFVVTGKADFRSLANSIIADMARIAAQQAASGLLSQAIGLGVSMFASGASSYAGGATSGSLGGSSYSFDPNLNTSGLTYQADGGAWAGGVQFFAKGGAFTNSVVNRPTSFGMAGGQQGVMGEAGPEAIVPLARMPDGSLGIRSAGGAAAGSTLVQVNAPVAITMEDRSSEGMELDQEALGRNLRREMEQIAQKAVSDSWRAGGVSFRNTNGRG